MRRAALSLLALVSGLAIASIGACGGRVIVDGKAGEGGAGGLSGAGGLDGSGGTQPLPSGVGASTFSGPGCSFPAPVGDTVNCGAMASAGPGMLPSCAVQTCDDGNNKFLANCTGDMCVC